VTLPDLPSFLFTPTLGSILSWLLAFALPVVAGLLMKQSWSTAQKGLVLLFLSAVKSYIEAWLAADSAGIAFNHVTTLYAIALNFGIAVASYFGILKGTTLQRAALNSGLTDGTVSGRSYPSR
jgi:hypothetical protein